MKLTLKNTIIILFHCVMWQRKVLENYISVTWPQTCIFCAWGVIQKLRGHNLTFFDLCTSTWKFFTSKVDKNRHFSPLTHLILFKWFLNDPLYILLSTYVLVCAVPTFYLNLPQLETLVVTRKVLENDLKLAHFVLVLLSILLSCR